MRKHPSYIGVIVAVGVVIACGGLVLTLRHLAAGVVVAKSAPSAPASEWRVDASTSLMDDTPRVFASLFSEQEVSGKPPILYVRCEGHNLSIFVDTRWTLNPEDDDHTAVRYRFDKDAAVSARLRHSVDQKAVFFDHPQTLMKELSKAGTLLVEYRAATWGQQTASFPVSGFSSKAPAIQSCLSSK